jgi:hypothetical protein
MARSWWSTWTVVVALALGAGCASGGGAGGGGGPVLPGPNPAPQVDERTLAFAVRDGVAPIAGCAVTLQLPLSGSFAGTTDASGYVAFLVRLPDPDPGGARNAATGITCPGYLRLADSFVIAERGNQDVTFGGTVAAGNQPLLRPGPVRDRPALAPVAESPQIRANFASDRGCSGELVFQIFVGRLWLDGDRDRIACWMERARLAGSTYFTVALYSGAYPGYPFGAFDFRSELSRFVDMLRDLQSYPAADGKAFRFVVYLSDGGSGAALEHARAQEYADALRPLEPYLVPGPGWETVGGCSDWSTLTNLTWLKAIASAFPAAPSFIHGCPGRLALSSHPLEPDDPFQGDEPSSFSSNGGELPRYFFYQHEHGRSVTEPCSRSVVDSGGARYPTDADCQAGMARADDVIARAGAGICSDDYGRGGRCGWRFTGSARPLYPVSWEGCTMDIYHGQTDLGCESVLADRMLAVFQFYSVPPMFGSGLPTSWRTPAPAPARSFTLSFTGGR